MSHRTISDNQPPKIDLITIFFNIIVYKSTAQNYKIQRFISMIYFLNSMAWEKLKYSKTEINIAGKILVEGLFKDNSVTDPAEVSKALDILDNWRAVHSYPMHVFQIRLKEKSQKIDKTAIISQRLKRVPAILFKLNRSYHGHEPSMKLFQMQDISGCRAVLSSITQLRELCDKYYLKGDMKHKRITFKDYIVQPKDDGYRSIHLVYEYKSTKGKKGYNGLRIEVQIRSKLQHLWATAVETVDFFTRQAIKFNEGIPDWAEFFRLVSSAFARLENCPCVSGTPTDEKELYSQIKKQAKELNVVEKMKGWKNAINSMTLEEIENPEILEKETGRISRIAKGSGTSTGDIRQLLKQYKMIKEFANSAKGMDLEGMDMSNPASMSQKQMMKLAKKFGSKKMMKFK